MSRPQPVPDRSDDAHRQRLTLRIIVAAVGREVVGALLTVGGLVGVIITAGMLAGPLVAWLVASALGMFGGLALLYRSDPYDPRYPPR